MPERVVVRLPIEVVDQLDSLVPTIHASRSDAVRHAIELYLYRLSCEHDARRYEEIPLTDAELLLATSPDSWISAPAW